MTSAIRRFFSKIGVLGDDDHGDGVVVFTLTQTLQQHPNETSHRKAIKPFATVRELRIESSDGPRQCLWPHGD